MKEQIISEINQTIYETFNRNEVLNEDPILREMVLYSLAFTPDGKLLSGGKRLRPLFCCLSCGLLCGDHKKALPYAAGLEMLHNFTLIHDDIEDNGDTRHNRPAVWKKYGMAQGLNAGDLLYEIALQTEAEAGGDALKRTMKMSSELFLGQHRDISFQGRETVTEADYFQMIHGKTGVLLGLSFALGAVAAGRDASEIEDFNALGEKLGLAFQIRDDYLGTWGKAETLGKSVRGDIMEKKNTLAVVYAVGKDAEFRTRWNAYDGNAGDAEWFAERMTALGAPEYLSEKCAFYTEQAESLLTKYRVDSPYWNELDQLAGSLLTREK